MTSLIFVVVDNFRSPNLTKCQLQSPEVNQDLINLSEDAGSRLYTVKIC